jgi:hypothetical protein
LKPDSGEAYIFFGSRFGPPRPPNQPPIANAGPDQTVTVGTLVTLDGRRSSDPDGDPITFQWRFVSIPEGSAATLTDADKAQATFTPDVVGEYILSLTVTDPDGATGSDTVKVTAQPPAPTRKKGDVDGDGDVDIIDAKLAAEFIVGLRDLDALARWAADVRAPCQPAPGSAENIDVTDVRWIAEFAIGVRTEMFCLEVPLPTATAKTLTPLRVRALSRTIEFSAPVGTQISVRIFDLQGQLIYQTESSSGALHWPLEDSRGRPVANGVYLYLVTVRDTNGHPVRSVLQKLVIRR